MTRRVLPDSLEALDSMLVLVEQRDTAFRRCYAIHQETMRLVAEKSELTRKAIELTRQIEAIRVRAT